MLSVIAGVTYLCGIGRVPSKLMYCGILEKVAEWTKAADCKSVRRLTLVRIQPFSSNYVIIIY